MAGAEKQCSDCRVEMVAGFILDMTYGGQLVPRWLEGHPEPSIWTGVKLKGKECRPVDTYRCPKCGLLRSYATKETEPPSMWGV
jgi:hypothetical protein